MHCRLDAHVAVRAVHFHARPVRLWLRHAHGGHIDPVPRGADHHDHGHKGRHVSPSASPALAAAARDSASLDEHAPARDRWRSDGRGETATFGSTITRPWANILGTGRGGSRAPTSAATDCWCRIGPHAARCAGARRADEGLNGRVRGGPAKDGEDGGVIRELVVPPDPPSPLSSSSSSSRMTLQSTRPIFTMLSLRNSPWISVTILLVTPAHPSIDNILVHRMMVSTADGRRWQW